MNECTVHTYENFLSQINIWRASNKLKISKGNRTSDSLIEERREGGLLNNFWGHYDGHDDDVVDCYVVVVR